MAEEPWYRRYVPVGSVYQRGRVWWYVFPTPEGSRKTVSLKTIKKTVAGHAAKSAYQSAYEIKHECSGGVAKALQEFAGHDKQSISSRYSDNRQEIIKRFIEFISLDDQFIITPELINRYLDSRAAAITPKTRKNERAAIGRFCRWLKSRGYIEDNPARDSETIKVPEGEIIYLSRDEMNKALQASEALGLWAVHVAIYTGFRKQEIIDMEWKHLRKEPEGRVIYVRGKGRKMATIPMHDKLPRVFAKIMRKSGNRGHVFPRKSSKWWRLYLDPIKTKCPTLDMPGQGWHTFRRTFGSILTQETGDIACVSKLMRHSSVAITMKHYAHLLPEHGRGKLNML